MNAFAQGRSTNRERHCVSEQHWRLSAQGSPVHGDWPPSQPWLVSSSKHGPVFIPRGPSQDSMIPAHVTMTVSGTCLGFNSGTHKIEREKQFS